MSKNHEVITLKNVEGFARKSGEDKHGNYWTEYELEEPHVDEETGETHGDDCCICGKEIYRGFLCLDGGDTVCSSHIRM